MVGDDGRWDLTDEEAEIFRYRYRTALSAGLQREEAQSFAESTADVGELRKLAAAGCDPDLIASIVL
jgi:hypothetical protein